MTWSSKEGYRARKIMQSAEFVKDPFNTKKKLKVSKEGA